ncbi:hypothetical protein [Neorhizobium sp. AL 9.2.2]|uniref:hypothetical protein n=1 Tax=Neorhizobium sp. AL 9.2.2 TaxID=2712894 RepID=UPI001573CC57|nr:hypothetical protein [Neorhizobium sp. AL 9.2.2]NSY16158.1 hypothetical protein [Neorhizobium sp. AL 9.2.2]
MFRITVSDDVLESMAMAAIEAYSLGDGRRSVLNGLETFGYLWGSKRVSQEETVFHLEKLSVSISAERTSESVKPHVKAARLKNDVMSRWAPHRTMLGSFHTHPYTSLDEVKKIYGYEFSEPDFDLFHHDDFLWEQSGNNPVNFAMTICKLSRVRESIGGDWLRPNIWQFDVGEFRLWLNVCVGSLDDYGNRCLTGNKRSAAHLELNTRFFNQAGDRFSLADR